MSVRKGKKNTKFEKIVRESKTWRSLKECSLSWPPKSHIFEPITEAVWEFRDLGKPFKFPERLTEIFDQTKFRFKLSIQANWKPKSAERKQNITQTCGALLYRKTFWRFGFWNYRRKCGVIMICRAFVFWRVWMWMWMLIRGRWFMFRFFCFIVSWRCNFFILVPFFVLRRGLSRVIWFFRRGFFINLIGIIMFSIFLGFGFGFGFSFVFLHFVSWVLLFIFIMQCATVVFWRHFCTLLQKIQEIELKKSYWLLNKRICVFLWNLLTKNTQLSDSHNN